MSDCHLDWAGGGRRQSTLLSNQNQIASPGCQLKFDLHPRHQALEVDPDAFLRGVDPEKTHVPVDLSRREGDGMVTPASA